VPSGWLAWDTEAR